MNNKILLTLALLFTITFFSTVYADSSPHLGEFTIDYEISEYPRSSANMASYTIKAEWSNNYQYLTFVVVQ